MSPAERDWDKELADIDKVIARAPRRRLAPPRRRGKAAGSRPFQLPGGTKGSARHLAQVILGGLLAVG